MPDIKPGAVGCRILAACAAAWPGAASAHVKWFCGPVNEALPPRPLLDVVQPLFILCLCGFLLLVLSGALLDSALARHVWPPRLQRLWQRVVEPDPVSIRRFVCPGLIRFGVGGYCLSLWDRMAVAPWGHGERAILTPELLIPRHLDGLGPVALLQAATGLLVLSRRTCPLAGLGLLALLGIGVVRAGLFHMTDYVYFLGLAWYLLTLDTARPRLAASRMPVLCASLSFALMWTAVEKFLYPQWTAIVLLLHPEITAGLPIPVVTTVAGFVEFSLSFYLIAGRSLLRLDAALLMAVFIVAIPSFGRLDASGHLPLVAMLAVIILHGATPLQHRLQGLSPRWQGLRVGGSYVAVLTLMITSYYALQHTAR